MKVIRKLKNPLIRDNGIECTSEIIVNDDLRTPLSQLSEFDGKILEPLPITESQKTFFATMARTFFGVSYLPRSVLQFALESCGALHFAFIEHNKDLNPDGTPKKAHFHYLVNFEDKVALSRLVYWLRCVEIRVVSTESVQREWDYLTHDSEQCRKEHKAPYNVSEIVSNDFSYWNGRCFGTPESVSAFDMFSDFCSGVSTCDMLKKFGFKFFTYYKTLNEIGGDVRFFFLSKPKSSSPKPFDLNSFDVDKFMLDKIRGVNAFQVEVSDNV